jgi:glycosyltransferase involved in cell wall biosynthesis
MRVLVVPFDLEIGGSQTNAVDLAGAVRDLGHEVTVFAPAGPLAARVAGLGLPLVAPPPARRRPSPALARHVARVVRERRIDVVHAYEHHPTVEAFYGATVARRVPTVSTVLSMTVPAWLPRTIPLLVGTPQLAAATTMRAGPIDLLEPPVDTASDGPHVDGRAFRAAFGGGEGVPTVVMVSRLSVLLKLDSVVTAMDAVGRLARQRPVRLVVVGGGEAHAALAARAAAHNAALGYEAIVLTGPLVDPRPAYAAADVVVGMGSSALRAMAFAKPVVVVGEGGFSAPVGPETVARFLDEGFYGVGTGTAEDGAGSLAVHLDELLTATADERDWLGAYGRALVESRYSLTRAARIAVGAYDDAIHGRAAGSVAADASATAVRVARWKAASRVRRAVSSRVAADRTARAEQPVAIARATALAGTRS